jgi:hypothetical protein
MINAAPAVDEGFCLIARDRQRSGVSSLFLLSR